MPTPGFHSHLRELSTNELLKRIVATSDTGIDATDLLQEWCDRFGTLRALPGGVYKISAAITSNRDA